MDIIEANECLRHSYGPPPKGTFDNQDVGAVEGEPQPPLVLPAEAAKARVAAAAREAAAAVAAQQKENEANNEAKLADEFAAIEGAGGSSDGEDKVNDINNDDEQ